MNNPVDIKFTASQEPSCNIDFVSFSKDSCAFEGSVTGCSIPGEPLVYLKCGAGEYPCDHFQKKAAPFDLSGNEISFKGSIPLIPGHSLKDISVALKSNGGEVFPLQVTIGKFVPLFAPFPQSACYYGPWKLSFKSPAFSIQWEPVVSLSRFNTFLRGMLGLLRMRAFKTVVFKTFYHIAKPFVRKQIWLISDRVTKAGDNGEALFRYLCALRPKDIHPVFVISKSSSDFKALRKTGSVVVYLSMRHKLLHLLSKCVISSAGYSPMNCPVTPLLKDIATKPFVFLQHGITNNDISAWVNRYSQNISGFVTAAKPEHASIIENPAYHYRDDQVWLTGFPRFDLLKNNSQRKITIMPTWRKALMKAYNSKAGVWQIANEFKDSDYVRFFSRLMSDTRLIASAKKNRYQLQFCPHPNVLPYRHLFQTDPAVHILDESLSYQQVFAESDLILTDYSSTAFDFAYLKKPIIYSQFDRQAFFSGQIYSRGYFDYEKDGFGEVETTYDGTVDRLIEYMENGCQMKPKYTNRVDSFFAFNDQKNCERVYQRIRELLEQT